MRNLTEEELEKYNKSLEKIFKATGLNVFELEESNPFFKGYKPIQYFNYDNVTKSNLFNNK